MLPQHQLILNSTQLTQHTRHAATTPTHSEQNRTQLTQHTRHAATSPTVPKDVNHWVFLNYNFSKEQCRLPEDDRKFEICWSLLIVLM